MKTEILFNSFKQNFESEEEIRQCFQILNCFKWMSEKLENLLWDCKDCFVDLSKKKNFIDINLYFGDLFFSVAKTATDPEGDEDVMYTVDRNQRTLAIGIMNIDEFIKNANEVMNEFSKMAAIA